MTRSRPRVLVNFASSLDGKINPAPARRAGRFMMSRGKEDLHRMRELRARADVVLIGAQNLRADDPGLTLETAERERRRAANIAEPWRVVLTTRGDGIEPSCKMFDPARGGPSLVAHAATMPAEKRASLGRVARLVELGASTVEVSDLLAWLADELGAKVVLCEGGGALCEQLFAARAVDELFLTLVPRILGGATAPTLASGPGFFADDVPDARLAAVERVGDELFLRYEFAWR